MSESIAYSVSIPMSILMDKKLSSTDKLVYAMICGLSKKMEIVGLVMHI